jgi:2-C-methyl-D-erythritol 4-phosphate cytidylyltransferase
MNATVLIVAGGAGRRMAGKVRKQYLLLSGIPIVGHTLRAFDRSDLVDALVLAVPPEDLEFVQQRLLPSLALRRKVQVVAGGAERQDSVFNGLCTLSDEDQLVAVHDGVRPFVPIDNLRCCLKVASEDGAALLAIPVVDTLKTVGSDRLVRTTLRRDGLWQAQTPQVFKASILREAHRRARKTGYRGTDDADLVQQLGLPVRIVPGSRENIKITTPDDLILAKAFCLRRQRS